jgi:predicted dienelactone hydrolase
MTMSKRVSSLLRRLVGLFLISGILSCWIEASIGANEGASQPRFNVGYQVLDLKCRKDGQEQTLTVAVWYPTAEQPQWHAYGGPTSGNVATDAMPLAEDAPYPLLVFSHGYGGSGISAVFFTEALAARGWIVACPDHHDRYSATRIRTGPVKNYDRRGLLTDAKQIMSSGPNDRDKYLYRLDEMRLALDGMLTSAPFGKLIDKDRIAVGGHSFGGFTALGLSGTIEERRDPCIKAVLLFSTGAGGYLFAEDELRAVRIPSMLFMGEREANQRRGDATMAELSARIYRCLPPPKYFLVVKGANHFSFNNNFHDNRMTGLLGGTEKQFEVIRRYSIAFLEKYVAGRQDAGHVLEQNDAMLTRYDKDLDR